MKIIIIITSLSIMDLAIQIQVINLGRTQLRYQCLTSAKDHIA